MTLPAYRTLQEVQIAIQEGKTTYESVVVHYLSRIEATRALNIYVEVFAAEALEKAETREAANGG